MQLTTPNHIMLIKKNSNILQTKKRKKTKPNPQKIKQTLLKINHINQPGRKSLHLNGEASEL